MVNWDLQFAYASSRQCLQIVIEITQLAVGNKWISVRDVKLYCTVPKSTLQNMAVFDKISGAEKPQIMSAGAQNNGQVWSKSELRGKSNKICLNEKTMKIKALGQIEVQNQ